LDYWGIPTSPQAMDLRREHFQSPQSVMINSLSSIASYHQSHLNKVLMEEQAAFSTIQVLQAKAKGNRVCQIILSDKYKDVRKYMECFNEDELEIEDLLLYKYWRSVLGPENVFALKRTIESAFMIKKKGNWLPKKIQMQAQR